MSVHADRKNQSWLVLRHVEHEHIGTLANVLKERQLNFRYADLFRGEAVPQGLPFTGLIIMGGPMGVYESDRYPFLQDEQMLIRRAADAGLPVLGICLGAQLIASSLGARVYPGPSKEIGWYPVELTDPKNELARDLPREFMAFHWHGDTFDLPAGAAPLFRSKLYDNQGFRWGNNVLAIQFHFEVNAPMVAEWLEDSGGCAEVAALSDTSAAMIRQQTPLWAGQLEELSRKIFGRFLEVCSNPSRDSNGASAEPS